MNVNESDKATKSKFNARPPSLAALKNHKRMLKRDLRTIEKRIKLTHENDRLQRDVFEKSLMLAELHNIKTEH